MRPITDADKRQLLGFLRMAVKFNFRRKHYTQLAAEILADITGLDVSECWFHVELACHRNTEAMSEEYLSEFLPMQEVTDVVTRLQILKGVRDDSGNQDAN